MAVLLQAVQEGNIVLYHAHSGHTYLTHSYILKKDNPPQCDHCQSILTVSHILVDYNHRAQNKERHIW